MVTTQQYMALSAVSYTDMPEGNNPTTNLPWTISELIAADLVQGYKDGNGNVKPEFSGLASLGSYTLVNSQPNTSSGFAAVAFQSPSGEIVFAFRGTEPNVYSPTNPTGIADDLITDAQIALGGSTIGQPNQFKDAETFFNSTLTIAGSNSGYSFTGHSMGGGIAQYMTYITGEAGHSTTFNAVGIGQVPALTTVNPSDYNDSITDYVNENDIIGNYGTQLGTTIYIQDQSGANINQATIDDILSYYASHKAMTYGTILGNNVNASAQIYSIHKDKIDELVRESFKAHNLSSFFSGTNPSNYSFANNASDSNLQELTDLLVQVGTSTEVEGTAAVVFTLSTGKQLIVSYAEGVLNVFVTFGEIVASIVYTIGDGIAEVLYNTGVAIGELTENAENGFNTFLQLFNGSEYVVINGTDENDTLSGPSIKANAIYAQMGDDTVTGTSYGDVLDGGAGNDTIYGNYGADLIYGREGDDIIEGGNSSDILFGGAGNDTLYGGDYRNWESFLTPERASDTLDGGAGNDMLQGGGGDDTYIFGRGYGHDVIFDAAYDVAGYSDTGFDTLRFTGNVAPSDIAVSRHYSDLIFTIIDTGETVTVSSFFGSNGRNAIEKVTFPDGTIWDYSTLLNKAQYIQGTEAGETIDAFYDQVNFVHAGGGDDTLNGSNGTDELYGESGNDVLNGNNGGDILDGGAGDDLLQGGAHDDTYRFGRGYGHDIMVDTQYGFDTLELVGDLTPSDIQVTRRGNYDLEFKIIDTGETFLVQSQFSSNSSLDQVTFPDGTIWDSAEIVSRASHMVGTDDGDYLNVATFGDDIIESGAGNDTIIANTGNDVLDGGTGDDVLEGGAGDDTYIFKLGSGVDTIYESDLTEGNYDKVSFGSGINPNDIVITRNGDNVELSIAGTDDKLILELYFSAYGRSQGWSGAPYIGAGAHKIEAFEFANGTVWDSSHIEDVIRTFTGTGDADYLPGNYDLENIISAGDGDDVAVGGSLSDTISGGAGNDTIDSGSGNDILDGGSGDDMIYAGYGDDSIRGGTGNDTIEGSTGNDTYYFNLGDGFDTIYDLDSNEGNLDSIVFGEGIDPADVIVGREGDNLTLSITGTDDRITVERYFTAYGRPQGWSGSPYVGESAQKIEQIVFADSTVWDVQTVLDKAKHINGTADSDYIVGFDTDDVISGGEGNDTLVGNSGNDELLGEAGNDVLDGGYGNDVLQGGTGDDSLYGSDGNDVLDGGAGIDILEGGTGDDTYLFNIGSGNDTIFDTDPYQQYQDKIVFGDAISEEDVTLQRNGDDLVFTFTGSTDTLTVERYFSQYGRPSGWSQPYVGINGNKIDRIEFSNGTVWNSETVIEKISLILGTVENDSLVGIEGQQSKLSGLYGDDVLTAASYGDYLHGGAGDDTLNGSYGQDVLRGGTGSDLLLGAGGADTYAFALGDGHDTIYDGDSSFATDIISFEDGIEPTDVEVSRVGNDLLLNINGGTDSITVQDYFSSVLQGSGEYGVGVNKVELIVFADGTVWDTASLEDQLRYINGTTGDDTLNGYETDDVITAQEGNDTVNAGTGNDVVDAGTGNDTIYGEAGNDQLSGGDGNDTLSGGIGNDILDGGAGDDVLVGGEGNDTYVFGLGSGSDEVQDSSTVSGEADLIAVQSGVLPEDVTVQRSGDDLVLAIANTTDSLTIKNYFSPYQNGDPTDYGIGVNKVEQVIFADGTIWNNRTLEYAVEHGGIVDPNVTFGTSQSESLVADQDGQTIYADDGDDTITGGAGNDNLQGEAGSDNIYAAEGNDTIIGGAGNDHLDGGTGEDTYVFSPGFGNDTIADYDTTQGNIDTIAFTEGIIPDDVTISRVGNNLILSLTSGDSITVQSYFASATSGYRKIEQVTFNDGTIWDTAYLETAVPPTSAYDNTITGSEYSEIIYGTTDNDAIDGGAGDDTIYSDNGMYDGIGNDLLDGGTGNDSLFGAGGDDTYVFGRGYGQDYLNDEAHVGGSSGGAYLDAGYDTLKLLPGVNPEDITVSRSGLDLILQITGTSDSMTIGAFFREIEGVYTSGIERVEFSDTAHTIWTLQDLIDKAQYIEGTSGSETLYGYDGQDNIINAGAGDDTVYGASGNDTIDGGEGTDMLEGGLGNDVYKFGVGSGTDTIYDSDSTEGNIDTILLQGSIAPEDVTVMRNGDHLELTIVGTTDKLTIENYFSAYARYTGGWGGPQYVGENGNKIEQIVFADETVWDVNTIKTMVATITGTENSDSLSGYSDQQNTLLGLDGDDALYAGSLGDVLDGGAGNDSLYGSSGTDTLKGGEGNDVLEGSYGDDTYVFGLGQGTDTIYDFDTAEGNLDKITFLEGIAPADVSVQRNGDNLEIRINNTDDVLIVERYFSPYMKNGGSYYYGLGVNKIEQVVFNDGTIWSTTHLEDKARHLDGTESNDTLTGYDSDDVINAGAGDDYIDTGYGNNVVNAGDGNDTIYAPAGTNVLNGEAGDDAIYGGSETDTIDGGLGNDILEGSYGNDAYVFGVGYGTDTIYDFDTNTENIDTINFLEGISATDVSVVRNGDNLEFHIAGSDDKLIVERYFSPYMRNGGSYYYGAAVNKIEQVTFDNGTIWTTAELEDKARHIAGTSGDDTIYGFDTDDVITAGAGNDYIDTGYGNNTVDAGAGDDTVYAPGGANTLNGGEGNDAIYGGNESDTIDGGTGNDILEGSYGNDTYVFGLGSGADTIYDFDTNSENVDTITFLEGIAPEDVSVTRSGDSIILQIAGTSDQLTIQNYYSPYMRNGGSYYYGAAVNKIEQIVFADSTVWTTVDLEEKARHITGTSGDDTIYGFDTDDIITANAGNDYIDTGYGNNTVDGGAGDDTIYAPGGTNVLNGGEGNDTIYGGYDSDTLKGGAGNDALEGSYGNDTYLFALGDGADTLYDFDTNGGNVDTIAFQEGIAPTDVIVKRNGDNLELSIQGTDDKLTIQNYYSPYMRNGGWYNYGVGVNKVEQITFADSTVWNTTDLENKALLVEGTSGDDTLTGYDTDEVFNAGAGNDYIDTGYGNNTVNAGDGNDTIAAPGGTNVLNGDAGNDTIYGGYDSDTLNGGAGNDALEGSYGNDTYLFAIGDGVDTIYDFDTNSGNVDTIAFQEGIAPTDIEVKRNGDNLELSIQGTHDKLVIQNYYSPYMRNGGWYNYGVGVNKIEQITFADSTVWSTTDLESKALQINGTSGDDTIYGFDTDDVITAGAGNDYIDTGYGNNTVNAGDGNDTITAPGGTNILNGESGDDTIYGGYDSDSISGGVGTDALEGSYGNDTYLFALGDGTDTIYDFDTNSGNVDTVVFEAGIAPADVVVRRNGDNIEFSIEGTTDKLIIQNYYSPYMRNGGWSNYGVGVNKIEQFTFSDSTVWNTATVENMALTVNGTSGDDTLGGYDTDETFNALDGNDTIDTGYGNDVVHAGAGNDIVYANGGANYIDGGTGNDALYGGWENDTYVFGEGYGTDTISDYSDPSYEDKVLFDFDQSDLILSYNGNDLVISIADASDNLTITSWSQNQYYQIEKLQASDGSTLANTQVDQLIQAMASYSANNNGITWEQALQQNPQDVQGVLSQFWVSSN